MPTKVFSTADFLFASSDGFIGADVTGAAAQIVAVEGTANWTQNTNADTQGPGFNGVTIIVQGSLIDDASVPAVITMTNVHVAYDWSLAIGVGAPTPVNSFLGEDYLAANVPSVTKSLSTVGSASGSEAADVDDLATTFGGTSRADLFAKAIAWVVTADWTNPFVAHTRGFSFTNYVVTVTYTAPGSVIRVNPPRGSVNGGQAVTITGTGFTSATGVEFGGVAATSVVIVDDEHITAVTPEHDLGVVDVEVLSVATGTDLYEYIYEVLIKLPPLPVRSPIQQGKGR